MDGKEEVKPSPIQILDPRKADHILKILGNQRGTISTVAFPQS